MTNNEVSLFFQNTIVNILDNHNLRDPQIAGYRAVIGHFAQSSEHAIIQIPVGCGKTGLMSILPFGLARGRILIIVPNLEIRRGVARSLDFTNSQCFWRQTTVISDFIQGPFLAELDSEANIEDCRNSHFVVTNIHQLASSVDRWLPRFEPDFFDIIMVDEAHHNVAESWQRVFERFPAAKVVSLTATPFRSDGQEVTGTLVYRYSFAQAMSNGYIKQLRVADAQPAEIVFEFQGDEHRHTLEEVLDLRDEAWFRHGVALSRRTNETIVDSSLELLDRLRTGGTHHQIIAAACTINHARQIASLYRERGYAADVISSEMAMADRDNILDQLRNNRLDCIVQVSVLGEGFDWPNLSIAAIFRPFRSLSPYIQFVGRVMRVLVRDDPYHPDNEGWVVSHIGLQQDERWNDFIRFDHDDQELFHELINGRDPGPRGQDQRNRRPVRPSMHVIDEVLDRLITRNFLSPTDVGSVDAVLAEIQRTLGIAPEELGLTREELSGRLVQARRRQEIHPRQRPVQPQHHRRELRRRLDEEARSVAGRIMDFLSISPNGVDVILNMPELRGCHNNIAAVIRLMHRAINNHVGVNRNSRRDLTSEQIEQALAVIDEIADSVQSNLQTRMRR